MSPAKQAKKRLFRVRGSAIHGRGVFAATTIPRGTRIVEYKGERISHREADARHEKSSNDPDAIVLLFIVDENTVIDAGVNGNSARFINHSCNPNCEAVEDERHIFIESIRRIAENEELTYDYHLDLDEETDGNGNLLYPCNCGSKKCRGTMAEPKPRRRAASKKRKTPSKK